MHLKNDHTIRVQVVHELPYSTETAIKGYAQGDGRLYRFPPEYTGKYLNVIIFEAERLEKLTQSLLELNKYGSKGTYLNLTVFDLNQLIKRTIQMLRTL